MQIIADCVLACVRSMVGHSHTLGFPLSLHFDTGILSDEEWAIVSDRFGEQTPVRTGVEYAGMTHYRDHVAKVGTTSGQCAGRRLILVVTSQCESGVGVIFVNTLSSSSSEVISHCFDVDMVLDGNPHELYQLSHDALSSFVDRLAQDLD